MTALELVKTQRRAAIYTRVSKDMSGRARSPEEQEADARRDCERLGWTVAGVYCDTQGASRFSAGGVRKDAARLEVDLRAGRIDVIVVWEASRLQRDLQAYVNLRDLCRKHSVLWSYNGRVFDLDDADDTFTTGLDALLSEREVEYTSKRVRRALGANAAAGLPHGRVLTGYRRTYDARTGQLTGQEPDPAWAPLIVEMFTRTARGESFYSIAKWLNATGHPLPHTGGEWTGARVAGQMRDRVAYLGHCQSNGRITVRGAWPALVDEVTFNRVQAILGGRGTGPRSVGVGLLTGLLRCGLCGGRVDRTAVGRSTRLILVYRCTMRQHLARGVARLEEKVVHLVLERLASPDVLVAFAPSGADITLLTGEMRAVGEQLAEVEAAMMAREIPAARGARILTDLERQADDLQARIDAGTITVPQPLAELAAGDAAGKWAKLPIPARRIVIGALLADMTLLPVGRGVRHTLGLRFRWHGSDEVFEI